MKGERESGKSSELPMMFGTGGCGGEPKRVML